MKAGGFDAVIGNPPYIRMEAFKDLKPYLQRVYSTHAERADIYFYFVEVASRLVPSRGRVGFILSNTFARSKSGAALREFISTHFSVETIVEFGDFVPFLGATVYPIITILSCDTLRRRDVDFVLQSTPLPHGMVGFSDVSKIPAGRFSAAEWTFEDEALRRLRDRLLSSFPSLRDTYGPANMGIKTGLNEAFIIDDSIRRRIVSDNKDAAEIIKPYLGGRNLERYRANSDGQFLIYTYHGIDIRQYPAVLDHLQEFKRSLTARATRQEWYELQQPQQAFQDHLDGIKIIYPDLSRYPKFSMDLAASYFSNTVYFIPSRSKALLGLLNSALLWFVIRGLSNALRGGLWRFRLFSGHIERLPIPEMSGPKAYHNAHNRMVRLVDQMLDLHKRLPDARTPQDKTAIERQIAATDQQIDQLVYELYGLTDDEIKLVEESTSR